MLHALNEFKWSFNLNRNVWRKRCFYCIDGNGQQKEFMYFFSLFLSRAYFCLLFSSIFCFAPIRIKMIARFRNQMNDHEYGIGHRKKFYVGAVCKCVCDNSVRRFKRRTVNEKDNLYLEFFSFSCQSVNCTSKRFAIRTELNRTLKALRFDRTPLCIRFNRAVLFRNSK